MQDMSIKGKLVRELNAWDRPGTSYNCGMRGLALITQRADVPQIGDVGRLIHLASDGLWLFFGTFEIEGRPQHQESGPWCSINYFINPMEPHPDTGFLVPPSEPFQKLVRNSTGSTRFEGRSESLDTMWTPSSLGGAYANGIFEKSTLASLYVLPSDPSAPWMDIITKLDNARKRSTEPLHPPVFANLDYNVLKPVR